MLSVPPGLTPDLRPHAIKSLTFGNLAGTKSYVFVFMNFVHDGMISQKVVTGDEFQIRSVDGDVDES